MSRADGFDRMDVSTSIADDPKFRALARRHPELFATAPAYIPGLLALSWRDGQRLTLEDAWPVLLPWDPATVAALAEVGLVDAETRIPESAWERWFGAASERRQRGRDRRLRADLKRGHTRSVPAVSQTDRQSVRPSVGTSVAPALAKRWRDGRAETLAPTAAILDAMTGPGSSSTKPSGRDRSLRDQDPETFKRRQDQAIEDVLDATDERVAAGLMRTYAISSEMLAAARSRRSEPSILDELGPSALAVRDA